MTEIIRVIEGAGQHKPPPGARPPAQKAQKRCKDCGELFNGASLASRCRTCKRIRKRDADGLPLDFPDREQQDAD